MAELKMALSHSSPIPTGPPSTDEELLVACETARSTEAFAQIVARHGPMVYRTCFRLLGNAHDAEDAVQAVFLLLARKPGGARPSLAGWLYTVAQNTALKVLRDRTRRARREEAAAQMKTQPSDDEQARLREEIDAALQYLPPQLQEAVVLCHLEGRSQQEAAHLLGCHQGTLSRRVGEALERLRGILVKRGVVVSPVVLAAFLAQEATATAAVPAGALAAATTLAAGASTAGAPALLLADGVAKMLFWAKAKLYLLITAAAVVPVAVTVPLMLPKTPPAEPVRHWLTALAHAPDGKTLAAACADHTVKLFDPATGQVRGVLEGHGSEVTCVAFAPDGKALVSGGRDGRLLVWDPATGQQRTAFPARGQGIVSLRYTPDGKSLVIGEVDNGVYLRDLASGDERALLEGRATNVFNRVAVSADGRKLATSAHSGMHVKLWDLASGEGPMVLQGELRELFHDLAILPDSRTLVSVGRTHSQEGRGPHVGMVRLWDLSTRRLLAVVKGRPGTSVVRVAASPTGPLIAWVECPMVPHAAHANTVEAGIEKTVRLYDTARRKELASFIVTSPVLALAFAPDGKTLAVGDAEGTVTIRPVPAAAGKARLSPGK